MADNYEEQNQKQETEKTDNQNQQNENDEQNQEQEKEKIIIENEDNSPQNREQEKIEVKNDNNENSEEKNQEQEETTTDTLNQKSENNEENLDKNVNYLYNSEAILVKGQDDLEEEKSNYDAQSIIQSVVSDDNISEEEQDLPSKDSLKKENSYNIKKVLYPKFSFIELTQPQLKKIMDLKVLTEETIAKTVKSKGSSSKIKSLASKNINRFCYDGYDLDLTYITSRIIAMGLPSSSIKGLYRNSMEQVQSFLNTRHPSHYKVYNLCQEKEYSNDIFFKQGYYPFKDHEAPPINLIRPFCVDAKCFLNEDENNVIAVHSKEGRGRVGTFICCLLLYMKIFDTADECLQYYGMMRMEVGRGLTVPSQIRYVNYFEKVLKFHLPHPITFVRKFITNIRMFSIPMFHKKYLISFTIDNNGFTFGSGKQKYTLYGGNNNDAAIDFIIDNKLVVEGDVQVVFYRNHHLGKKDKIFKFWFNTNFIPNNNIYGFEKKVIDIACKDKDCKYFKSGFRIEVHFNNV